MICPKGGSPIIRHNEVRDLTADLLTEVCHDVEIEPILQELTGGHLSLRTANTEDGARLDVKAQGFWENRWQCAFFDIRVFYPNAQSNQLSQLSSAYSKHEAEKKRTYGQRVREVEHGSFTPLVFTSTGVYVGQVLVRLIENYQSSYYKEEKKIVTIDLPRKNNLRV